MKSTSDKSWKNEEIKSNRDFDLERIVGDKLISQYQLHTLKSRLDNKLVGFYHNKGIIIHPLLHLVIMAKNSKYHHLWSNPSHQIVGLPEVYLEIAIFYMLKRKSYYVHLSRLQGDSSDIVYSSVNNDYSEDHRHYIELCH